MDEQMHHCIFNKMIDCGVNICVRCGWNPAVSARRLDEMRKEHIRDLIAAKYGS